MKKIGRYIAAYGLWFVTLLLGLWLFILCRETLTNLLSTYYVGDALNRSYQARFFNQAFPLVIGLGWLLFMVVSEEFMRRSVKDGGMIRQFCRFAGIETLLIFVVDFLLLFSQGFPTSSWLRMLILAFELLIGILLTYLGYSSRSPLPRKTTQAITNPPQISPTSTP